MNFGTDNLTLTTAKSTQEIETLLRSNTHHYPAMLRVITTCKFIGEVGDDWFKIIGSDKKSVVCIVEGQIEATQESSIINIRSRTRKAFIVLFYIWCVVIFLLSTIFPLVSKKAFAVGPIILLPIMAIIFRLFIHYLYVRGRNKTVKLIRELLETT